MFENAIEDVGGVAEGIQSIDDRAIGCAELADAAWKDVVADGIPVDEAVNELADLAWQAADGAANIADGAAKVGKDMAYVDARATLGVAKLAENALKTAGTSVVYVVGDHEKAAEIAQMSVVDNWADGLDDFFQADEGMRDVGDKAELVGEAAAGIGLSVVAPAGAAAVAAEALFAMAEAGEVLESQSADGELDSSDMSRAVEAGAVSAAFAVVANKATSEILPRIADSRIVTAAKSKVDDFVRAATHSGDDVAKTAVRKTDDVVKVATHVTDDGARAGDDVAQSVTREVDDVVQAGDDAAEVVANEADEVAQASDDVAETAANEVDEVAQAGDNATKTVTREVDGVTMEVEQIDCRNARYEGTTCPETGVPYERRIIKQDSGRVVEGVFPKFESSFDAKINPDMYLESNYMQFKECNKQLAQAIENDPALKRKFSDEVIEQIKEGCKTGAAPDGYVWHHNEKEGVLQLVDAATHGNTRHTGGRSIWG